MADDVGHSRPPEPITITILRLHNLRGVRGEGLIAMVKLEWNEKVLGESVKIECSPDSPSELNFTASISVGFDDPRDLDDVAHKPLLISIIEVLPKEKKQREEKTNLLGQCTADLYPLLQADTTKNKQTLQIHAVSGSVLETQASDLPKPELDLQISVNDPLISSAMAQESNLMNITLESLYSPPDAFQLTGPSYVYIASLPLPVTSEKETTIVFGNGALKPGLDKEPANKQKKWFQPGLNALPGNALYIPNSFIQGEPIEKEDGDYKSKDDREHRTTSEQDKNRVTWNTERRCYLENSACKLLQDKIAKHRLWPVEVMRLPMPAGAKGKKDEENQINFHGVAYINLAPLLYPGVTRIKGAYKIYPYTDLEYQEKTKRKHGTAEEALKTVHGQMNRGAGSPFPKKGGKDDKKTDSKKGKAKETEEFKDVYKSKRLSVCMAADVLRPVELVVNATTASAQLKAAGGGGAAGAPGDQSLDIEPPANVEGQQYVESKSYATIEISLSRPMVPKRPPQELARRVAEYIPPRPAFPKRTNGAQKAVDDFHSQVMSIAQLILQEFRSNGALEELRQSLEAPKEDQRQALLYELNSSGKYFAFKEQLKHSVIKIVREKYLQTTTFSSQEQLQSFLSELYVYLVDQMHVALGKFLSLEDKTPVPKPLTDSAQLKHFAREAEINQDYQLASKYYNERIARDRLDPEAWFDYGTFNLHINDKEKAEECFKECVSLNQSHLNGLILYGIICVMDERIEAAETFFEAATNVAPKSVIAWTMLSLFYERLDNDIGAEMASIEANKFNVEKARQQQRALLYTDATTKDMVSSDYLIRPEEVKDIELEASAGGQTSVTASKAATSTPGASRGGNRQLDGPKKSIQGSKKGTGSASGSNMGSRTKSQESVTSLNRPASQNKSGAATPEPDSQHIVAVSDAIREPTPVPTQSIYMQTIEWLLEVKATIFTERALANQLILSSKDGGPTAEYYIAMARLKLQKNELSQAYEDLNEALQLDYQNPNAWGIMGHLKYLMRDNTEAKDCYERTLSFMTDPTETHSIYLRLASIYLEEGEFTKAKHTFLQACRTSPSCISWLGVGIACYRLGELGEAEEALSEANILNNEDPEVWGYLSMVCLRTARQLEAEQAYKYAVKLHLKDLDLMNEIKQLQVEVGFGNPQL